MDKVLNNLRRQCSRREYCSSDIIRKAEKALDGDTAEAERVLHVLIGEKYVDDLRYASAYAREKSSIAGWGAAKIRYMLAAKSIDKDTISRAMEEIDEVRADERLVKLIQNKCRSLKDEPQLKIKILRFALGRGYSYEEVSAVLKNMKIRDDEEI